MTRDLSGTAISSFLRRARAACSRFRNRTRTPGTVLQASINVIAALDIVEQAVGLPADEVLKLYDEANRWNAVEGELRAMLNGVSGANLIRRQRLDFLASQAYNIGRRLAHYENDGTQDHQAEADRRLCGGDGGRGGDFDGIASRRAGFDDARDRVVDHGCWDVQTVFCSSLGHRREHSDSMGFDDTDLCVCCGGVVSGIATDSRQMRTTF